MYIEGRSDNHAYCSVMEEEYLSILEETGLKYFEQITSSSGTSKDISNCKWKFSEDRNIDLRRYLDT